MHHAPFTMHHAPCTMHHALCTCTMHHACEGGVVWLAFALSQCQSHAACACPVYLIFNTGEFKADASLVPCSIAQPASQPCLALLSFSSLVCLLDGLSGTLQVHYPLILICSRGWLPCMAVASRLMAAAWRLMKALGSRVHRVWQQHSVAQLASSRCAERVAMHELPPAYEAQLASGVRINVVVIFLFQNSAPILRLHSIVVSSSLLV